MDNKEGKSNLKLFLFMGIMLIVFAWFIYAQTVAIPRPGDGWYSSNSTVIFNFTATGSGGVNVTNCSLYANFTGAWNSTEGINETALNVTNGIGHNFTISIADGIYIWNIRCNDTAGNSGFNDTNRTLGVDTTDPRIVINYPSEIGQNISNNNLTINITFYDVIRGLVNHSINVTVGNKSNETYRVHNFSCVETSTGANRNISVNDTINTTCTFTQNARLFEGVIKINVSAVDGFNHLQNATRSFMIDTLAPQYVYFNITNHTLDNRTGAYGWKALNATLNASDLGSVRQGDSIDFWINWTDLNTDADENEVSGIPTGANMNVTLEVYNESDQEWYVVNQTPTVGGWSNLSIELFTGHNVYEGKNVTFRVNAADYAGNQNITNLSEISWIGAIQVNDTTTPTITIKINSSSANETNISGDHVNISWVVTEETRLKELNVSVIGYANKEQQSCYFKRWVAPGPDPDRKQNSSLVFPMETECADLLNASNGVRVIARDSWDNEYEYLYNFTVDNTPPPLNLTSIINRSNITTTSLELNLSSRNNDDLTAIKRWEYSTTCNTTHVAFSNTSKFRPFNTTSCKGLNQTIILTINVTDGARNYNISLLTYYLDEIAPDNFTVNLTNNQGFADAGGRVNFTWTEISDAFLNISWFGYYIDSRDDQTYDALVVIGNHSSSLHNMSAITNFTAGTHSIKFWANDSAGNSANSSWIRNFTIIAKHNFSKTLDILRNDTGVQVGNVSAVNISYYSNGTDFSNEANVWINHSKLTMTFLVNSTHDLDSRRYNLTVSLEDINGSAANWDRNFTVTSNDSVIANLIETNWTTTVVDMVVFENTKTDGVGGLNRFLPDANSYYGKVIIPYNASNSNQITGVWWFENATDAITKTIITACSGGTATTTAYNATESTPCFNVSLDGNTTVYVPHFDQVVVVNDTGTPPQVHNVSKPWTGTNYNESTFIINVTFSSDAKTNATFFVNDTSVTATNTSFNDCSALTPEGRICLSNPVTFKNLTNYTLYLYVWDDGGNLNGSKTINFSINDSRFIGNLTTVRNTSIGSTTAIISWNTTEYANASVNYGTTRALGTTREDTSYDQKLQSVSLSSLGASTQYYYNVTSCDSAGNCNSTGYNNFTTTAAASSSSSSSSSSGGSSGGFVSLKVSQSWSTIASGESVSVTVTKSSIPVTDVTITAAKALSDISVEVRAVRLPSTVPAPDTEVYKYTSITAKNVAEGDLTKATVKFTVLKSWITSKGLTNDGVALFRYVDGAWQELPTKYVRSLDGHAEFEAETPGFSYFAVGASTGAVIEEEEEEVVAEEEEVVAEEEEEEVVTPVAPVEPKKGYGWLIVLAIVVIGVIGYVVYTKKKK